MRPTRFSNSQPLTGVSILAAPDGDHADPAIAGLILRVRGAAASWVYRFTSPTSKRADAAGVARGIRREIGLGSAHRESLDAAEAAAKAARANALRHIATVSMGEDPAEARRTERTAKKRAAEAQAVRVQRERRTLGKVIRGYHECEIEGAGIYTDKHCAAWLSIFERHLKPYEGGALWTAPIDEIEPQQLLDFFKALQKKVPHTARKARQRLDAVYEYALLKKWCNSNPTKAIVRAVRRGAPSMKSTSHRALPYAQAPALYKRLVALDSTAARCLRFCVLTAARTTEALRAEWSEMDLDAATWIVPAEKMKAREAHRVDLSTQAVALLRSQLERDDRWVFPSPTGSGEPMSNMALLLQLRRLKIDHLTTTHGLARSTFSTYANERGIARPDVIEAALGHREADLIRAAYNRAAFVSERRALLQTWADYLALPMSGVAANDTPESDLNAA